MNVECNDTDTADNYFSKDSEFDSIESKEQSLMQHIRTAGIRKPRETELINEVLSLRTIRRKQFNLLNTVNNQLNNENEILRSKVTSLVERLKKEIDMKNISINQMQMQTASEIASLTKQHDFLRDISKEKLVSENEERMKQMKKSYENKLKIVDTKLQELLTARAAYEIELQSKTEFKTSEKLAMNNKIIKYKNVIQSLLERENSSQEIIKNLMGKIKKIEFDDR